MFTLNIQTMSNDKHTPTKWISDFDAIYSIHHGLDDERVYVGYCLDEADAARIVQCVNACDGLHDPEFVLRIMKGIKVNTDASPYLEDVIKELESLQATKAKLIEALERVRNYLVDNNDVLAPFPNRSEIDNIEQTLAKIETK
jgi:hypothetical protein